MVNALEPPDSPTAASIVVLPLPPILLLEARVTEERATVALPPPTQVAVVVPVYPEPATVI